MPPGVGPAALIVFLPFALVAHALCISALHEVRPKRKARVEERRHESEEPR